MTVVPLPAVPPRQGSRPRGPASNVGLRWIALPRSVRGLPSGTAASRALQTPGASPLGLRPRSPIHLLHVPLIIILTPQN